MTTCRTAAALLITLVCVSPLPGEQGEARSSGLTGRELISHGIVMVRIPAGAFTMGTADTTQSWFENARPLREVRLDSFRISATEITQAQFEAVMGYNPSLMRDDPTRPVDQVSWYDAAEFCNRLSELEGLAPAYDIRNRTCVFTRNGYRLPTEAEWEYACRAGTSSRYYTGRTESDLDRAGWYRTNSQGTTHPVAGKAPNAWGLYDMHGNVWEWCNDWMGNYRELDSENPRGPSWGSTRVLRGGGWHYNAVGCRSDYRHRAEPQFRLSVIGFRIVRGYNPPSGIFREKPPYPGYTGQ